MEQVGWGPEDDPAHQRVANYPPSSTTVDELSVWKTHWKRLLTAFPLKVSWEKPQCYKQKTGEFPIIFHQQFVDTSSEFTSMDLGADQNHPLVLSTIVLALLLPIQVQIKVKGVELQGRLLLKS